MRTVKCVLEEVGADRTGSTDSSKPLTDFSICKPFYRQVTDEVRAWTFHKGLESLHVQSVIHTDFEKGFIRVEVIK